MPRGPSLHGRSFWTRRRLTRRWGGRGRCSAANVVAPILVSLLVKGVFVLLAPFGLVALWAAVLADMGTSVAVTLNGLRLFRKGL